MNIPLIVAQNTTVEPTIHLCDEPNQCSNQSLDIHEPSSIDAFQGALGPLSSYTGHSEMYCDGVNSCKSMAFIKTYGSTLYCRGSKSCIESPIHTFNSTITCQGYRSCRYSVIKSMDTLHNVLECAGDQSCAYAEISSIETIEAEGAYSLCSSIIDSVNISSTLKITLSGKLAAYNATLRCRKGHTCNIYCDALDSCSMFNIECSGTCDINTLSADTIVPLYQYGATFDTETFLKNNDGVCNSETTAVTLDVFAEKRLSSNITITNNEGPLCCRGTASCKYVDSIVYNSNTSFAMFCSAASACHHNPNMNLFHHNLYCEGAWSCANANIHYTSLYCSASSSCRNVRINTSQYILCSGRTSCLGSTIVSGGFDIDVYFIGKRSGEWAEIHCNGGDSCNIYCSASNACDDVKVYCSGICFVECDEHSKCPEIFTPSPTVSPTVPTLNPTRYPTSNPTRYPTVPTLNPTLLPTLNPTSNPTSTSEIEDRDESKDEEKSKGRFISNEMLYFLVIGISFVIVTGLLFHCARRHRQERGSGQKVEDLEMFGLSGGDSAAEIDRI